MRRIPITELTEKDVNDLLADWGEPKYRSRQILDWVYDKSISDFSSMTNLPPKLRERLDSELIFQSLEPETELKSQDGNTTKVLFRLNDGLSMESVLMKYEKRRTICVSSQVGCAFACPLCTTGTSGFERNLTPAEIIDQVLFFSRRLKFSKEAVSNIVFMGMGEPLVNLESVWRAIEVLTSPSLFGLGARHVTISTSGIVPGIRKLKNKRLQVGLAVSLHAPIDELRDVLVPPNRMYPLEKLMQACREYVNETGRRISFEYVLIKDLNDSSKHVIELSNLLRGLNCFVNIIPVNKSSNSQYNPPGKEKVQAFSELLMRHHVPNTVRVKRGVDIDAGCGQLRARVDDGSRSDE